MSSVLSYVLLHTVLSVSVGVVIGFIISAILYAFFGWLWWPVLVVAAILGLWQGITAYVFATQPWRG